MTPKKSVKDEPKHYNVVLVLEDVSAEDMVKVYKLEHLSKTDFNRLGCLHGTNFEQEPASDEQSEALRWLANKFYVDVLQVHTPLAKQDSRATIYNDTYAVYHVFCDIAMMQEREDSGYYDEE